MPTVGETFDFLTYGSLTGSYDTVLSLDSGYSYSVSYNNADGIGTLTTDTVLASVPEASSLGAATLMLVMGSLLLLRRKGMQEKPGAQGAL
jgi:hypothetical protein